MILANEYEEAKIDLIEEYISEISQTLIKTEKVKTKTLEKIVRYQVDLHQIWWSFLLF